MPIDRGDREDWLARIEQMIEEYRADQRRQVLQQVAKCRRLAGAHKARLALEEPSRVH